MTIKPIAALCAALFVSAASASSQTVKVTPTTDNKLWIDGSSNLHDWSCKATQFDASVDFDLGAPALPKTVKSVQLAVLSKGLKCSHDGMDNNVYKALKADGNPSITFAATTATVTIAGDTGVYHLSGTLSIAGKSNPAVIDVRATRAPDGTLRVRGSVPVKMTDFGISPPTAILGTLKTKDLVTVGFDLIIDAKAQGAGR